MLLDNGCSLKGAYFWLVRRDNARQFGEAFAEDLDDQRARFKGRPGACGHRRLPRGACGWWINIMSKRLTIAHSTKHSAYRSCRLAGFELRRYCFINYAVACTPIRGGLLWFLISESAFNPTSRTPVPGDGPGRGRAAISLARLRNFLRWETPLRVFRWKRSRNC